MINQETVIKNEATSLSDNKHCSKELVHRRELKHDLHSSSMKISLFFEMLQPYLHAIEGNNSQSLKKLFQQVKDEPQKLMQLVEGLFDPAEPENEVSLQP